MTQKISQLLWGNAKPPTMPPYSDSLEKAAKEASEFRATTLHIWCDRVAYVATFLTIGALLFLALHGDPNTVVKP